MVAAICLCVKVGLASFKAKILCLTNFCNPMIGNTLVDTSREVHQRKFKEIPLTDYQPYTTITFMATGYTSKLLEKPNMPFSEFALTCARAFGALVEMRDDPLGAKIPTVIKPSKYNDAALKVAKKQLAKFRRKSPATLRAEANEKALKDARYALKQIEKSKETNATYDGMIAKVKAWRPPTRAHSGLKKFMLQQLVDSKNFDDMGNYYANGVNEAIQRTYGQYVAAQRQSLKHSVTYHKKAQREENARAAGRTKWIQDLMASLGVQDTPAPDPANQTASFKTDNQPRHAKVSLLD